ncbi:MAG: hypothetical protein D6679_01075 [Candidatus Hydrogenedentota bacterium]|nr:MAG: hypothetical protein D6679_01075 [Candidatus Hydrogenedentota bacterium]
MFRPSHDTSVVFVVVGSNVRIKRPAKSKMSIFRIAPASFEKKVSAFPEPGMKGFGPDTTTPVTPEVVVEVDVLPEDVAAEVSVGSLLPRFSRFWDAIRLISWMYFCAIPLLFPITTAFSSLSTSPAEVKL